MDAANFKVDFPRKILNSPAANGELLYKRKTCKHEFFSKKYEGWNFNSGNY